MWNLVLFKQKAAYEMLRSLVGSEMCIRDRRKGVGRSSGGPKLFVEKEGSAQVAILGATNAVSYTHLTPPTNSSV